MPRHERSQRRQRSRRPNRRDQSSSPPNGRKALQKLSDWRNNSDTSFAKRKPGPRNRKYNVIFFETFMEATQNSDKIEALSQGCDQINVVILAEGNMDDPNILDIAPNVKLFAGAAWHLIHKRREEDGWYKEEQE